MFDRKTRVTALGLTPMSVVTIAVLVTAAAVGSAVLTLPARSVAQQDVPMLEPHYTRLFSSSSLNISMIRMSPDGRWIVFSGIEDWKSSTDIILNLFVVSADGGEPIRLTSGAHMDSGPVWFPSGDRIAFRSDRPGPWAIMTLPIDTETGQPAGPFQQVTLEGSSAYCDVSPDGRWISYTPVGEEWDRLIRVVPSTGGTARTIGKADGAHPVWSPDGQSLYYVVSIDMAGQEALVRMQLDGTQVDTVFTWPERIYLSACRNTGYVLREVRVEQGKPTLWDLATLEGHSLGRFTLPERMHPESFFREDLAFLATMSDDVAHVRILPINGGPARQLTEERSICEPLAWTPDGERVLFATNLNGDEVLLLAPVNGGPMEQFRLPDGATRDFTPVFSADGRHLLYATGDMATGPLALNVLDLADQSSRELTAAYHPVGVRGRGGMSYWDGEEFVYIERRGDVYELRASPPEGSSRLLWSFGRNVPGFTPEGDRFYCASVYGDRIMLVKRLDQQTVIYLASVGQNEARELVRLDGALDFPIWSPDGRWIAATCYQDITEGFTWARIVFIEVAPSGEPIGEPMYVGEPALAYWNLVWLPDSRGILAVGIDANVWYMPLDPAQQPVALTRDDPNRVWSYIISPDGSQIVYSSFRRRGNSIWRVDLGDIPQRDGN